jgi:hypothetical protein
MNKLKNRRAHAIVPRSLLAYASLGLAAGALPMAAIGCDDDTNSPSIGIRPAMFDGGESSTIGVYTETAFDSSSDSSSDIGTIGIRPAMDFDAGESSTVGIVVTSEFASESASSGSSDTSGVDDAGTIGIRPAMDFDAGNDQTLDAGSVGIEPAMHFERRPENEP